MDCYKKRFVDKAKARIPSVTKSGIEGLSVKTGEKLWESMIRPVLEYATEVWGGGDWKEAEQIQNKVGRILLGLSKYTSGEVARGELGWLSLKARRSFKQLLFWGKLVTMDNSRLVKQVYLECRKHTENLKGSFCSSVKNTLLELKLGHLWVSEAVGDLKGWTSFISSAIRSYDTKLWLKAVQEKPKLRLFKCLKSELVREDFLEWNIPASHRERGGG